MDDFLVIGRQEHIKKLITDLNDEGFKLKVEGKLDDYLSCKISFDEDKKGSYIHQPHLLMKIEKKFGSLIKNLAKYLTPGTPHKHILRGEEPKIDES